MQQSDYISTMQEPAANSAGESINAAVVIEKTGLFYEDENQDSIDQIILPSEATGKDCIHLERLLPAWYAEYQAASTGASAFNRESDVTVVQYSNKQRKYLRRRIKNAQKSKRGLSGLMEIICHGCVYFVRFMKWVVPNVAAGGITAQVPALGFFKQSL